MCVFLAQTRTAHVPTYTTLVLPNIAFQFKDFESVNDVFIHKATSNNNNNDIIDADFSFKMKTYFYCKSSLTTNTISLVPIL